MIVGQQQQETNIVQPESPISDNIPTIVPLEQQQQQQQQPPVVIQEVNSAAFIPNPSKPIHQRLVRVVRKLPMLEKGPRMRYFASPSSQSNLCRRCSHVAKCKRRQKMSLLDSGSGIRRGSAVQMETIRRLSNSPQHVVMEAPKVKGKFFCRKINGRTVCRATEL